MKGLIKYLKHFLTGSGGRGVDTSTESTDKLTWKYRLAYVFVFIVIYNFIIIPVLTLFGVMLPPVPLEEVWKLLGMIVNGG